jgi:hypothetical protein
MAVGDEHTVDMGGGCHFGIVQCVTDQQHLGFMTQMHRQQSFALMNPADRVTILSQWGGRKFSVGSVAVSAHIESSEVFNSPPGCPSRV